MKIDCDVEIPLDNDGNGTDTSENVRFENRVCRFWVAGCGFQNRYFQCVTNSMKMAFESSDTV